MRPISPRTLGVRAEQGTLNVCKERALVNALRDRDVDALGVVFSRYHDPLLRIIQLRMDGRLRRRLDEDDVFQESYLHAERRLDHFADVWSSTESCLRCSSRKSPPAAAALSRAPRLPRREATTDCGSMIFLWLRLVVRQTLVDLYRHHLATHKRDLHREVASDQVRILIGQNAQVVGRGPAERESASGRLVQNEMAGEVREAVARMSQRDQRVISLRLDAGHGNTEIAAILGVSQKAASIAYARALARLKRTLG